MGQVVRVSRHTPSLNLGSRYSYLLVGPPILVFIRAPVNQMRDDSQHRYLACDA